MASPSISALTFPTATVTVTVTASPTSAATATAAAATPTGYNPLLTSANTGLSHPISATDIAVCVVFGTLSITAVGFRFYAQQLRKNGIFADDYVIAAALVIVIGMCSLSIWGTFEAGLGWPVELLFGPAGELFERMGFAGQILWGFAIALIRTSLLLFYRRIFTTRRFRMVDTLFLIINAAWLITQVVVTSLEFRWTRSKQLINFPVWLLSMSTLDAAQDFCVLCLPLFVIRNLNMQRRRKILLSGVFMLGFFCVIVACIRLKYLADLLILPQATDEYMNASFNALIWSIIQVNTTLITACLPALPRAFSEGRFFNRLYSRTESLRSRSASVFSSTSSFISRKMSVFTFEKSRSGSRSKGTSVDHAVIYVTEVSEPRTETETETDRTNTRPAHAPPQICLSPSFPDPRTEDGAVSSRSIPEGWSPVQAIGRAW